MSAERPIADTHIRRLVWANSCNLCQRRYGVGTEKQQSHDCRSHGRKIRTIGVKNQGRWLWMLNASMRLTPFGAISARRRRLDDDRLAGVDHGRVAALQPLHAAVLAAHPVLADLTSLAAGKPERRARGGGRTGSCIPSSPENGWCGECRRRRSICRARPSPCGCGNPRARPDSGIPALPDRSAACWSCGCARHRCRESPGPAGEPEQIVS